MVQTAGNSSNRNNGDLAETGGSAGLVSDHLELVFCVAFGLAVLLALYSLMLPTLLALGLLWLASRLLRARMTSTLQPVGKAVLITGCDSGIGLGLAQRLAGLGAEVFAACLDMRSDGASKLQSCSSSAEGRLHVIKLDVTSDDDISSCLHFVEHHTKGRGLWSLVNNAGVMSFGEVELTSLEDYKNIMEVNVFGIIRVSKAFLPLVRKAKGRVVNVTSVRGLLPFPENSSYVITKFAAEALSDIMRMELRNFGVKVVIVEPGNFGGVTGIVNREFLRRRSRETAKQLPAEVLEAYGRHRLEDECEAAIKGRYSTYPNLDPVLSVMQEAVLSSRPRTRYLVDGSNRLIDIDCMLARLRPYLPDPVMDFLTLKFLDLNPVHSPTEADAQTHNKLDN